MRRSSAAAIASLLLKQRDAVGLATFDAGVRQYIPPASTSAHMRLLLEMLERKDNAPKTDLAIRSTIWPSASNGAACSCCSATCSAIPTTILSGLQHFRHRKHEVILFHILDRDELDVSLQRLRHLRGHGGRGAAHRRAERPAQANICRYSATIVDRLKRGCRELDMDYQQLPTDQPIDVALSRYLAQPYRN